LISGKLKVVLTHQSKKDRRLLLPFHVLDDHQFLRRILACPFIYFRFIAETLCGDDSLLCMLPLTAALRGRGANEQEQHYAKATSPLSDCFFISG
jgi:hypothetical protein